MATPSPDELSPQAKLLQKIERKAQLNQPIKLGLPELGVLRALLLDLTMQNSALSAKVQEYESILTELENTPKRRLTKGLPWAQR